MQNDVYENLSSECIVYLCSAARPTIQDTSLLVSETGFLGADDLIFKMRHLAKVITSVSFSRYTPFSNQQNTHP